MSDMEKEQVFLGSIGILYRRISGGLEFLIVENSGTKNISFVSGAKEENDATEEDTLRREIKEELGLDGGGLEFQATTTRHEFVFGPQKKERAGQQGSYGVFLVDATRVDGPISHTQELRKIQWLDRGQVMNSLSFQDLKEVFEKATKDLV